MKITKSQLKQIIKEEIKKSLQENTELPPEAQQLYNEGKSFLDKVISLGKSGNEVAGEVLEALEEYAEEKSHGFLKIKSLY